MSRLTRYPWLAISATAVALAIGSANHPAHATIGPATNTTIDQATSQSNRQAMAACQQLPQSQRDICADQAGYGKPSVRETLTPEQQAKLGREDAHFQASMAACKKLPLSQRTTCYSAAGRDRALTTS